MCARAAVAAALSGGVRRGERDGFTPRGAKWQGPAASGCRTDI